MSRQFQEIGHPQRVFGPDMCLPRSTANPGLGRTVRPSQVSNQQV